VSACNGVIGVNGTGGIVVGNVIPKVGVGMSLWVSGLRRCSQDLRIR
jgi:hypothetical protein